MPSKWVTLRERVKDIWKDIFREGIKRTAGAVTGAYPITEVFLEIDGDRVKFEVAEPIMDHIYDLKNLAKGRAHSLRDAEQQLVQVQAILSSLMEAVDAETGLDTGKMLQEAKDKAEAKLKEVANDLMPEYLR